MVFIQKKCCDRWGTGRGIWIHGSESTHRVEIHYCSGVKAECCVVHRSTDSSDPVRNILPSGIALWVPINKNNYATLILDLDFYF